MSSARAKTCEPRGSHLLLGFEAAAHACSLPLSVMQDRFTATPGCYAVSPLQVVALGGLGTC